MRVILCNTEKLTFLIENLRNREILSFGVACNFYC